MSEFKTFLAIMLVGLIASLVVISIFERKDKNDCVESFKQTMQFQKETLNASLSTCKTENKCLAINSVELINGVTDISVRCTSCQ